MTKTYEFGSSKRESHDASRYYDRALFNVELDTKSTVMFAPTDVVDQIYNQSSEDMSELPDNSVALMVTSPPYHVGKEYDSDEGFDEYLEMLQRVFAETHRVLEPGGRAAINVAGLGRKPYVPLPNLVDEMCRDIGFFPRGELIWQKAQGSNGNCAWGSWMKPTNPTLRDVHEYILVYSKGRFDRTPAVKVRAETGMPHKATISRDEFMEWTLSVWQFPPASAKRVKHPAPFPVELPHRLIQLYTFEGDLVLDPFCGAGTTAVAAVQDGRHYVGYDTSYEYVKTARARLAALQEEVIDDAVA